MLRYAGIVQAWEPPRRFKPAERKALLNALNGRSPLTANGAANEILQNRDPALLPALLRTLRQGDRLHNRIEAAYALRGYLGTYGTVVLERIVSDRSSNPHLRAFVAETLAHRHRPASHGVLLRNLSDRSAEVRFWCAFALGAMREKKALPPLKQLAETDDRIVRGWWAVGKEAKDAIEQIEAKTRRGSRRCWFCQR